jgi:hypothetical protein
MSDVMLLGVLRMPIDLAMSTDESRTQYWSRGQEAADRIEADTRFIEELRQEIRDLIRQVNDDHRMLNAIPDE